MNREQLLAALKAPGLYTLISGGWALVVETDDKGLQHQCKPNTLERDGILSEQGWGEKFAGFVLGPFARTGAPNLLLEWAVMKWREEVEHRPLVNVHRRKLDGTWRQVMRYAGGDPDELVGPLHDALLAHSDNKAMDGTNLDQQLAYWVPQAQAAVADLGQPEAPTAAPLDMVLHCSKCGLQHIDAPETDEQYNGRLFESSWWECGGDKPERWTNPPHRSHKCSHCNFIWRPADVPTNGVAAVKTTGKADSPIAHPPARSGAGSEESKDVRRPK